MLDTLPSEVLVNIISRLDPLEEALENIPCVCRAWRHALGPTHDSFWRGLAGLEKVVLPAQRGRSTRLASDPKRAFRKRRMEYTQANAVAADKVIWNIWMKLHKIDCATLVRRAFLPPLITTKHKQQKKVTTTRTPSIDHRLRFYENRTLLMLASWRGRTKVVSFLLENGASIFCQDDRGATALLIASWAGNTAVVKLLLVQLIQVETTSIMRIQQLLDQKGAPPKSSSCGGHGAKTALCWAERKGFRNVVQLLQRAGATESSEQSRQGT